MVWGETGVLRTPKQGKELTDMAAMNMNQEQFKQLIREEKPVLVDFWAPWCSYCRRIGPAYEKIGEEYADSLAVGKINIDEEPRLAGAEGIADIPTRVM